MRLGARAPVIREARAEAVTPRDVAGGPGSGPQLRPCELMASPSALAPPAAPGCSWVLTVAECSGQENSCFPAKGAIAVSLLYYP